MDQNPERQTDVPQPEQPSYSQPPFQANTPQFPQPADNMQPTALDHQLSTQSMPEAQPTQPIMQQQVVQQPPVSATQKNPGLVFGIIGIVLSFIFLAPIGLVLSIIGTVRSHRSQMSAVVSIVGIVLNTLALIGGGILLLITVMAHGGVQQRAEDVTVKTNAYSVASQAERYFTEKGSYPASASELASYVNPQKDYSVVADKPTSSSMIQYTACSSDGGQVLYLLPSNSSEGIVAVGNASSTSRC